MSLDRSLKTKGSLSGVRSVLTRAERIAKMTTDKKGQGPGPGQDPRRQGRLISALRKTRF